VLADNLRAARTIGDRHLAYYLRSENYRKNLARLGWSDSDLEPPGSAKLFEEIVAWGSPAQIYDRVAERFEAGADQIVFNLISSDSSVPPLTELEKLAPIVNSRATASSR